MRPAYPSPNHRRFLTLAVGIWGMFCAGNISREDAFGLWSETLARSLWGTKTNSTASDEHIDTKLNTLYEWTLIGVYIPISGLFYQWYGSRKLLLAGAILMSFGYSIVYLAMQGFISAENWILLCFAFFCIGQGTGYVDTGTVGTNLKNFKDLRGSAAGILKGYFGLSASIIAVLYTSSSLIRTNVLLFLGPGSGIIVFFAALITKEESKDYEQLHSSKLGYDNTSKLLLRGYTIEILITLLLLLYAFKESMDVTSRDEDDQYWLVAGVLLLMLVNSFGVWMNAFFVEATHEKDSVGDETFHPNDSEKSFETNGENKLMSQKPYGTSVCTIDFLCIFITLFVGTGSGLMVISNASRICLAKGGETSQNIDLFVSLLSVWNCIGRLASGWVSDQKWFVKIGFGREKMLVYTCLLMILGQAILYFSMSPGLTFVAATFVGASYGSYWTLFPTLLMDLFGEEKFGFNYAVMQLAPTFGSLLFSRIVSTWFYELNAQSGSTCTGYKCFGYTHLIIIICLFVSFGFSVQLALRAGSRNKRESNA